MKADSTGNCCHIPCHPLLRDGPFVSHSRHNNTNSLPITASAELMLFKRSGWNLTFEPHLRTVSFGSLLSSGVETAVPLLLLHSPEQLFMLLALPRARCSFWLLSSFFAIPAPPLPPPAPPPSGKYLFGLSIKSITTLLRGLVAPWWVISPVPALLKYPPKHRGQFKPNPTRGRFPAARRTVTCTPWLMQLIYLIYCTHWGHYSFITLEKYIGQKRVTVILQCWSNSN